MQHDSSSYLMVLFSLSLHWLNSLNFNQTVSTLSNLFALVAAIFAITNFIIKWVARYNHWHSTRINNNRTDKYGRNRNRS